jgi:hypothetical protein
METIAKLATAREVTGSPRTEVSQQAQAKSRVRLEQGSTEIDPASEKHASREAVREEPLMAPSGASDQM